MKCLSYQAGPQPLNPKDTSHPSNHAKEHKHNSAATCCTRHCMQTCSAHDQPPRPLAPSIAKSRVLKQVNSVQLYLSWSACEQHHLHLLHSHLNHDTAGIAACVSNAKTPGQGAKREQSRTRHTISCCTLPNTCKVGVAAGCTNCKTQVATQNQNNMRLLL